MIVIYPDSNALHRNIGLTNPIGQRLRQALNADEVQLVLSPVVLAELERQSADELSSAIAKLDTALERYATLSEGLGKSIRADRDRLVTTITESARSQSSDLLVIRNVDVADWPDVKASHLAERELERRRPFLDTSLGTVGHRDAVIWEGVLALAQDLASESEPGPLVLVSKDGGFRAKGGGLHPDLLEDLEALSDAVTVTVVPSIYDAMTLVELQRKQITKRIALLRSELSHFAQSLVGETWTFDAGELPAEFDEPRVIDVEYLGEKLIEDGDPAKGVFTVHVDIEGAMRRDTWSLDMSGDIELWAGLLNDHYVSAYVSRTIEFEVEIEADGYVEVIATYDA